VVFFFFPVIDFLVKKISILPLFGKHLMVSSNLNENKKTKGKGGKKIVMKTI